jgi:hypothetical protein
MMANQAGLNAAASALKEMVARVVERTPVIDMHTHLFAPSFGSLNLWGIDELLTYHYLVAEFFRSSSMPEETFWNLGKTQQADAIWQTLFVENGPLSEAAQGVLTVLQAFGLNTNATSLKEAREWFAGRKLDEHITQVMREAGVTRIVMTNDAFDPEEAPLWMGGGLRPDARFDAVLRLDTLLNNWRDGAVPHLVAQGFAVDASLNQGVIDEVRRFLSDWIKRMNPVYVAVSLPDTFVYPDELERNRLMSEAVLPVCRETGLPFAMMIGVRRQINPRIRVAGDGVGKADMASLERLCFDNPDVKFLVTVLSRENQHELCVSARKFRNLMPFGCWWFMNNPELIREITGMRLEMLGPSFIPQHSDARVLEQVIYKWKHSRRLIAEVLGEHYLTLKFTGRNISHEDVQQDVTRMFQGNFLDCIGRSGAQN